MGQTVMIQFFFDSTCNTLRYFDCDAIIWGGDFNCVLDVSMYNNGSHTHTHVTLSKVLETVWMNSVSLIFGEKETPTSGDTYGVPILPFSADLIFVVDLLQLIFPD